MWQVLDTGWVPQKQTLRWALLASDLLGNCLQERPVKGWEVSTPRQVHACERLQESSARHPEDTDVGCLRQRLGMIPTDQSRVPQTGHWAPRLSTKSVH